MTYLQDYELQLLIVLNVMIAVLLGGVIGYARERKNKPAGLRTHMIISGSAALIYSLSGVLINDFIVRYYRDKCCHEAVHHCGGHYLDSSDDQFYHT